MFRQESELLTRFGHRVVTYLRSNHEIEERRTARLLSIGSRMIWGRDTWRDITMILHEERPSIVHVHNTFTQVTPSVYSACGDAGIPVVQTLHNFRLLCPAALFYRQGHICEDCANHSLWRGIAHGCYRNSHVATTAVAAIVATHRALGTWSHSVDRYTALSEFSRRKFVEGGLPEGKITVKPNFVHPDPGIQKERGRYVIYAGRLSEEKGVRTLLRAWERIGNSIPLVIVGDGPLRRELEEASERAGLSSIVFLGRVQRHVALSAMQGACFSVLPSQCYENFPMTIVESFACGVPVVCSRLGAMQEIVEQRRTGLLFTPGDSDYLADTVMWAWEHTQQMKTMGIAARQEYEQKYTAEKNYELLTDIYRRAMNKYPPQSRDEVEQYAGLHEG